MTIVEAIHYSKNGEILWSDTNLKNVLHTQGQEFMMKALFAGSSGVTIPSTYHVGLDNRTTVNQADTIQNLVGEPVGSGYQRYSLSSQTGFGAVFDLSNWKVKSSTLIFNATGSGWGPVRNAFLTTAAGNSGFLISTVPLSGVKTITNGESFTFKIVLGLGG